MFKDLASILKIVLVFFSAYLSFTQFNIGNKKLGYYWIVVGLYWFFNYLSGFDF